MKNKKQWDDFPWDSDINILVSSFTPGIWLKARLVTRTPMVTTNNVSQMRRAVQRNIPANLADQKEIKQLHMRDISRSSPPWKAGFCWAMCAACTGSSLNISEKTTPRLKTSHAKVTTESGGQYCWQVMGGTSPSTETEPKSIMNTLRWSWHGHIMYIR